MASNYTKGNYRYLADQIAQARRRILSWSFTNPALRAEADAAEQECYELLEQYEEMARREHEGPLLVWGEEHSHH